ncbi:hypothetical protein FHX42_004475 [Saccharopolyspora lacisalsi]|uniref:Uncharacterized protein n=1 Tax=Halosaccharopolyspora lacisalsi TaxID=1000566 RepID=A0A839E725_9PSEU|nr:hypothetical protein [Halosaccharopolyspora lacisalsi]MBA8827091.1 hypothetical protein [Halosaccharopolyspora lacisalsi]
MGMFSKKSQPPQPKQPKVPYMGWTGKGDPNCSHTHYDKGRNHYGEWHCLCADCGKEWTEY